MRSARTPHAEGMNDTIIITGYAGADASATPTTSGVPFATVRVASTHRRTDPTGHVHETTTWYRVVAFHALAEHLAASVRKGDAVIVTGRLRANEWEHEGRTGTTIEIVADAVGHNLRFGTTSFVRGVSSVSLRERPPREVVAAGHEPRADDQYLPDAEPAFADG